MPRYKVRMYWYSELLVSATNKADAKEKAAISRYNEPEIEKFIVQEYDVKNKASRPKSKKSKGFSRFAQNALDSIDEVIQ